MNKRPAATHEKGQSLVEMALTATLMLFLLLATIDFGIGFLYWITLRDAAQEGAMYGSLNPQTTCYGNLRARVRGAATSPLVRISNLPDSQIVVTRTGTTTPAPGDAITVLVTYQYRILTPLVSTITNSPNITISASTSNVVLQVGDPCP